MYIAFTVVTERCSRTLSSFHTFLSKNSRPRMIINILQTARMIMLILRFQQLQLPNKGPSLFLISVIIWRAKDHLRFQRRQPRNYLSSSILSSLYPLKVACLCVYFPCCCEETHRKSERTVWTSNRRVNFPSHSQNWHWLGASGYWPPPHSRTIP